MSQVYDDGKGFRFVTLWAVDQYGRQDKLTFILSKGTVLIREHHEYSFGFDTHGDLLIAKQRRDHSDPGPLMNGSGLSDRRIEGWYFPAGDPMVVELKKILADEINIAIDQVVLGGT